MSVYSILSAVSILSIGVFGQSANIEFVNKDGTTQWWHAFFISNMNENAGALTNVEIQDSTVDAPWEGGNSGDGGDMGTFYSFQSENGGWVLPLSIRLTNCAGDRIVFNDIIDSTTANDVFTTNNNFGDSTCDTDNIIIKNKGGISENSHGFFINNANSNNILSVEFQDSSEGADWVTGVSDEDSEHGTFYTFEAPLNEAWVLPYSVRLTNCNGVDRIRGNDIIISLLSDAEFDFGSNFEVDDACPPESEESEEPEEPVSENMIVTKLQGDSWWVAFEVDGVSEGTTISSVELRDSGSNPSDTWVTGESQIWGTDTVWTFAGNSIGRAFVEPLDIRVTDSNQVSLVSNDLVTSWDNDFGYDFGDNF